MHRYIGVGTASTKEVEKKLLAHSRSHWKSDEVDEKAHLKHTPPATPNSHHTSAAQASPNTINKTRNKTNKRKVSKQHKLTAYTPTKRVRTFTEKITDNIKLPRRTEDHNFIDKNQARQPGRTPFKPFGEHKSTMASQQNKESSMQKLLEEEKKKQQTLELAFATNAQPEDEPSNEPESEEDILARKLNSLLTLRERSMIYMIDHKLHHDQVSREMSSQLITLTTDEMMEEIIREEVLKHLPQVIYENMLREVSQAIVQEQHSFTPLGPEKTRTAVDLVSRPNSSQVICSAFGIDMKRSDLACLRRTEWLNDEVINFYLGLCIERCDNSLVPVPKCHFFTTFFYTKLVEKGSYNYANVRRWTKKVDLFSKDKVIIPIHLGVHWTCAVINLRDSRFEYYDSMGGVERGKQVLKDLQKYIQDECKDKKNKVLNTGGWEMYVPDRYSIPQQENSHDCGVFACKFADFLSRDLDLSFKQSDMAYFRNRMACEIMDKRIYQ
ncbi:hypothetical protein AKO1_015601 [Acrasis kona]|uniref:Ubiquitin-like protease family profile domain-containing protein n=1 Tax=Acrasis kona TaxID=1008807 RepID=A0AAW2ZF18_9EUKA